ncbi:MAG: M20/M25/M40 family metallo-hydrolase [Terrisporobacter othiniensis]|uniref:M20/M25/M40 family metallo-hydrolase n=1 Tax=Terrisporobacter othiniensis TaxID=1577792 RepID=UPI002908CA81|nr:M20/M25/M40 family metallo-hydrolase [Terrisporobacter othiniensis]MDU6986167.1 M20/M25/M40 family metallo-hydrolase [Terrisporobacter othiniensis]
MVNRQRLIDNFINMVKVDSPSGSELEMATWLINYLKERNIEVKMDSAGDKIGGNCGNIVAYIKGESSENPICFAAHMDQVMPCNGVKPIIDGNIIKTDATTTLGADDKGGIAVILEALECVLENKDPHRDIYLLFTVAEEIGLKGAKNLDTDILPCKDVIIFDAGGATGSITYKGPTQETIEVTFHGKKAHAGVEPEKGINAIVAASHAISNMRIGRLDEVTTTNIGRIEGGGATNVVTDKVTFSAEVRSHSTEKLEAEVAHMKKCCEDAANKIGATYEFKHENAYPRFELDKEGFVFKLSEEALRKAGVEPIPQITGGGSDANIIAGFGYRCAVLSLGMYEVHTVNEYANIDDMYNASTAVYHMMSI